MTTAAQLTALTKAVSPDRLQTYTTAAAATGCDALDLYIWDRDLSMALLADVAIVEVALRNSMHAALEAATSTPDWYLLPVGFDDRSQSALSTAWSRVRPRSARPVGLSPSSCSDSGQASSTREATAARASAFQM